MDREKVINQIEVDIQRAERTGEILVYVGRKTAKDIIVLLKEQEPRVMTLEEVKRHNNQDGCVWFEQPTYNAVAAFARKDDEDCTEIISPYLLGDPINHCYMGNRFYGNAWRCWTSRPTDEQRQAVKWE